MYIAPLHTPIVPFKVCEMCYQANLVYLLSSKTKLPLSSHESILLIPLRKDQKLIFRLQPLRPLVFHLSAVTLLSFTIQHIGFTLINSVLKLY